MLNMHMSILKTSTVVTMRQDSVTSPKTTRHGGSLYADRSDISHTLPGCYLDTRQAANEPEICVEPMEDFQAGRQQCNAAQCTAR